MKDTLSLELKGTSKMFQLADKTKIYTQVRIFVQKLQNKHYTPLILHWFC